MAELQALRGRKPGDRRILIERPHARYFRYLAPGVLEAKLEAQAPRTAYQRHMARLRAILFGKPLPSEADLTERLPKWKALPIFASDVMSSVAYASGASMLVLLGAGTEAFKYLLQLFTTGILVLAAQTSFADFPRLSSFLARDGFFPRRFALRGERLAFNSGIVALAAASILLVAVFNGSVEGLIGLYAVGVFTSFTLSQAGMVRHAWRNRGPGWQRGVLISGVGSATTFVVALVVIASKFEQGAWIVLVVIPILVAVMLLIRHEYDAEGRGLEVQPDVVFGPRMRRQRVVVAAQAMSRAVVQAVRLAQTMGEEVQIVHVTPDRGEGERFRERVDRQLPGVRVVLVESPYRALVRPFVRYLEVSQAEDPEQVTIVLLPEHLPRHWWDRVLYNQNVHRIRSALMGRRDFVILDCPYLREA
jgi:hypothetical protein